ncbi:MAG: exodeoxyribonuclease VII small subunit [Coriobacteriia bacterium]|nr:exodeoxyribonuclease VII small subunit [Coriobacteriia bacterium]
MTENKTAAELEAQPFGQSLEELQAIVAGLESGSLELEDSLAAYQQGVALIAALNKKLDDAKQQVEVLMGEISADRLKELQVSEESRAVTDAGGEE